MFDVPNGLDVLVRGVVLTMAGLLWVLLVVRVVGLRSFSKMTAFDFVATVATGSLLATAATSTRWSDFMQVGVAILALMAVQAGLATLRKASGIAREMLGNTPILLMRDGRFLEGAMRSARVAREDVLAKIRGANVSSISAVRAVVLETTGDISVLHGADPDQALLEGVRGAGPAPV